MVRGGNRIHSQNRDPERSSVNRDREDADRVIVLDRLRHPLEIGDALIPIEVANEYFGKTGLGRLSARASPRPSFRIVNSKRHRVEIALVVKAGFLNELLVFWIVVDRVKRLAAGLPNPAVIDVQKSVRSRQEPGWLWWRMLSQLDGKYYGPGDNHNRQNDRESASYSHEMGLGLK